MVWCLDYCKIHDGDVNPKAHRVFYSGCQVCDAYEWFANQGLHSYNIFPCK